MDRSKEIKEQLAYLWLVASEDDGVISEEDSASHVLYEVVSEETCPTTCSTGDWIKDELEVNTPPCDLDQVIEACNTGKLEQEHVLFGDDAFDLEHVLEWDWFQMKNLGTSLL